VESAFSHQRRHSVVPAVFTVRRDGGTNGHVSDNRATTAIGCGMLDRPWRERERRTDVSQCVSKRRVGTVTRSEKPPSSFLPRATPQFCGSDDVRVGDRCDLRCVARTVRWRDRSEPSQYLVRMMIAKIPNYSVTKEQRQSARRQKPSTPRSVFRQTSHTPRQAVCRYPCKTTIPWWWQMRGVGIDGSRASSAARFAPGPVGRCSRTVVRRTRAAGGRHRSSGRSTSERTPGSPVSTATASASSSSMSRPPTSPSTSSSASK